MNIEKLTIPELNALQEKKNEQSGKLYDKIRDINYDFRRGNAIEVHLKSFYDYEIRFNFSDTLNYSFDIYPNDDRYSPKSINIFVQNNKIKIEYKIDIYSYVGREQEEKSPVEFMKAMIDIMQNEEEFANKLITHVKTNEIFIKLDELFNKQNKLDGEINEIKERIKTLEKERVEKNFETSLVVGAIIKDTNHVWYSRCRDYKTLSEKPTNKYDKHSYAYEADRHTKIFNSCIIKGFTGKGVVIERHFNEGVDKVIAKRDSLKYDYEKEYITIEGNAVTAKKLKEFIGA